MSYTETEIAETVARQAREDAIGHRAAAEPLPGPLRDAFAIQPRIKVGPYNVRPVVDGDFETLALLEHPVYKIITFQEKDLEFQPRGQAAWELYWILTRSLDEVDAVLEKSGVAGLRAAAKKEFRALQLPALMELNKAFLAQVKTYWSTAISYGEKVAEGEQPPDPTKSSAQP